MNVNKDATLSNSLRAGLLRSEPIEPARLLQLQEQLCQLSEHRLTKTARIWWGCGLGASVLFAAFGGFVATMGSIDRPLRIVWWLYTAANVCVVCFAGVLLRRGRGAPKMFFWFGTIMVLCAMGCFVALLCRAAASTTIDTAIGAGFGAFCVIVSLLVFLYGRISGAHLSATEHLLRLELLILSLKDPGAVNEMPPLV